MQFVSPQLCAALLWVRCQQSSLAALLDAFERLKLA
jgi:hypothetical protein